MNGDFSGAGSLFTVRSPEFSADAYRLTPTVMELEHYGKVKEYGNWGHWQFQAPCKILVGEGGFVIVPLPHARLRER